MFHPIMFMPPWAIILDLSVPAKNRIVSNDPWWLGLYNEVRVDLYTQPRYKNDPRCVHMGIDLGGPAGVAIHAFVESTICYQGARLEEGDYGHVIVLQFILDGSLMWALYGHLSAASLHLHTIGDHINAGTVIGWLGNKNENGGWPPHLHFQLSTEDPKTFDMPGIVTLMDRETALQCYPDPAKFGLFP